MKIVTVFWHDAHADAAYAWQTLESSDHDPYLVATVGMLLEPKLGNKRGHVSICQSLTQDEFVDHIIHIPKAMVQTIVEIGEIGAEGGQIKFDEAGSNFVSRISSARRGKRSARRKAVGSSD